MDSIISAATGWIMSNWQTILWIIFLFFFGRIILKRIIKGVAKIALRMSDTNGGKAKRRLTTLQKMMVTAGNLAIVLIVFLMALDLFGIDIMPILTGVGIAGLAIGFGAKALVQDSIAGFFILVENQYDVGDTVRIDKFEGAVRQITLRSTVLCDREGNTVYLPNGGIKSVVNCSQGKACKTAKKPKAARKEKK